MKKFLNLILTIATFLTILCVNTNVSQISAATNDFQIQGFYNFNIMGYLSDDENTNSSSGIELNYHDKGFYIAGAAVNFFEEAGGETNLYEKYGFQIKKDNHDLMETGFCIRKDLNTNKLYIEQYTGATFENFSQIQESAYRTNVIPETIFSYEITDDLFFTVSSPLLEEDLNLFVVRAEWNWPFECGFILRNSSGDDLFEEYQIAESGHDPDPAIYVKVAKKIQINKIDASTKQGIAGAKLAIYDINGEKWQYWTSDGSPRTIYLPEGEYTLIEEEAPENYSKAENKKFSVDYSSNNSIILEMEDEPILPPTPPSPPTSFEVNVLKINEDGTPLSSAEIEIFKDQVVIENFTTTTSAKTLNLLPGTYTFHEKTAPEGYLKIDDFDFTVTDTGSVQILANNDNYEISGNTIKVTDIRENDQISEYLTLKLLKKYYSVGWYTSSYIHRIELNIKDHDNLPISGEFFIGETDWQSLSDTEKAAILNKTDSTLDTITFDAFGKSTIDIKENKPIYIYNLPSQVNISANEVKVFNQNYVKMFAHPYLGQTHTLDHDKNEITLTFYNIVLPKILLGNLPIKKEYNKEIPLKTFLILHQNFNLGQPLSDDWGGAGWIEEDGTTYLNKDYEFSLGDKYGTYDPNVKKITYSSASEYEKQNVGFWYVFTNDDVKVYSNSIPSTAKTSSGIRYDRASNELKENSYFLYQEIKHYDLNFVQIPDNAEAIVCYFDDTMLFKERIEVKLDENEYHNIYYDQHLEEVGIKVWTYAGLKEARGTMTFDDDGIVFRNEYKETYGSFLINKRVKDSPENPVPGAVLQVINDSGVPITLKDGRVIEPDGLIEEVTTDENGVARTSDIYPKYIDDVDFALAKYRIEEPNPPFGYSSDDIVLARDLTVQVKNNGVKEVTVTNEFAKKEVIFSKTTINNTDELPGAILEIYKDNEMIEQWTSTSAKHEVELSIGEYRLVEHTAPDNYDISEDIIFRVTEELKVEVKSDNNWVEVGEIQMKDAPLEVEVEISKQDIHNEDELSGATLVVEGTNFLNEEINISWLTSDKSHRTTLKPGTYTLKESEAPSGYSIAEPIEFTITGKGEIICDDLVDGVIVMKDFPAKPDDEEGESFEIEISKVELGQGDELVGALLKVIGTGENNSSFEESWLSDGSIKKIELAAGTYRLIEDKAPLGYDIAESIDFEITEEGKILINGEEVSKVIMEDKLSEHTVKISKVNILGQEIPGAKIEIRDSNNELVQSWTSIKDTTHSFEVVAGQYTLRETLAPSGYQLVTDIIFTVNKDGSITVDDEQATALGNVMVVTDNLLPEDKFQVLISKTDLGGKELVGAKITVQGEDFEETWTSTLSPHSLLLKPGDYTLLEVVAPNNYERVETEMNFSIDENGKVEVVRLSVKNGEFKLDENGRILLMDAPIKNVVEISKVDATTSKELPGATLVVKDSSGKVIEQWVSANQPHKIILEPGDYTLTEITAPNGYEVAETIKFSVGIDGLVGSDKVIMKDSPIKTTTTTTTSSPTQTQNVVSTGFSNNAPLYVTIIGLSILLVIKLKRELD